MSTVVNFRFDIHKTITQTTDTLKRLSVFNPLTIRKKGTRAKAIFALHWFVFFGALHGSASKEGVRHMPPLQMAGIRQLLGGLCYVLFFFIKENAGQKEKNGDQFSY